MSNQAGDPYALLFGDSTVTDHLTPHASVQAMLDVEAALAAAGADAGIIPETCVDPIVAAAKVELYELATLGAEASQDGNLAIPLVRHLTRRVASHDVIAARYVHWGATSQDILDTALVLQLQAVGPTLVVQLKRAALAAAMHARRHINTVMPGRTWLQQATPITFGLKAAGWCDALDRQHALVGAALEDVRVLQFGGASGTLAALGDAGPRVAAQLGERLGLKVPELPWHTHRDRLVKFSCALGIACGTCGKIARDVSLLSQTEVGEARESHTTGGGSSTMPHKHNPVYASVALAAAVRAPGLIATMLAAMPQEHERGLGGWQAEWATLPELVRLTAGAARATVEALEGLVIDAARMRTNTELTHGLVMSEAIAMALAAHIDRSEAHQCVERASRNAALNGRTLADALIADAEVRKHLTPAEIHDRLSPDRYLGAARTFVERVLNRFDRRG